MNKFKDNALYNFKSKKKLYNFLYIDNLEKAINNYNVYITKPNRLVEQPIGELERIHRRIFKFLKKVPLPDYLFSSKKGVSYIDNAKQHQGNQYVVALDLSKFFPNCNASYINKLFVDKFNMSKDVAYIMTNICTIDTSKVKLNRNVVNWYEKVNGQLKYSIPERHIPTGSSLSQLLAFLSFKGMFDEMYEYAIEHKLTFSVFVDDVVISSKKPIKSSTVDDLKRIASSYGHQINKLKVKRYGKIYNKKITGVIIRADGTLKSPSSKHQKCMQKINEFKNEPTLRNKQIVLGNLQSIKMIEPNKFKIIINEIKKAN